MGALARLIRLAPSERRLVLEAAWLIVLIRLAMSALRFGPLERFVARLARARTLDAEAAERVAWAVGAVGRRVPGATCLVQALAAQVMLRRRGVAVVVRVGVARDRGGPLESHAWVERDGRVILGDVSLDRYVPIVTWGSRFHRH